MIGSTVTGAGQIAIVVPTNGSVIAVGTRDLATAAAEGVLAHIVTEHPLLTSPIIVVVQILNDSPPSDLFCQTRLCPYRT